MFVRMLTLYSAKIAALLTVTAARGKDLGAGAAWTALTTPYGRSTSSHHPLSLAPVGFRV